MARGEKPARPEATDAASRWVAKLARQPFLRASFAYGGELRLHFGRQVPYENPRLSNRTRGEWVLGLRATPWVLVADGAILSRSHDEPQDALHQFAQLEGTQLTETRFRRSDAAVTLRFGAHAWFMALTEPRGTTKAGLDLWELLTPDDMFVVAGPERALVIEPASARIDGLPQDPD